VKCGITGWAQAHGLRGQTSIADRVAYDNHFIDNWSFWLELRTVALTVAEVLHPRERRSRARRRASLPDQRARERGPFITRDPADAERLQADVVGAGAEVS
jgi:Bacterial sugar transferase